MPLPRNMSRRQFVRLASCATLGGVAGYAVFVERYLIAVNRYRIPVPHLPPAFAGFTLAHLTDLHYGFLVPLAVVRDVVRSINRLRADAIVCTGDYIHERHSARQIDAVWPVLAELRATHGVYAVLGNHDHWGDTERSAYWLDRNGQNLRHRAVFFERGGARLWLAGAGDLWEDHVGLDRLLANVPPHECRMVLAHNPDTADTNFSARVDLMVSGHTHGGQVNLPLLGAPVLPVNNKTYTHGLKRSPAGVSVFIARGIGWAIWPIRFNCPPEIAVLELVPA